MGSLSPSVVEKKASQSLPAFEEGAALHHRSPPRAASVTMRLCRISFEGLPLG